MNLQVQYTYDPCWLRQAPPQRAVALSHAAGQTQKCGQNRRVASRFARIWSCSVARNPARQTGWHRTLGRLG
eukprot:8063638-Heterocapsa_arctica.AAC.1